MWRGQVFDFTVEGFVHPADVFIPAVRWVLHLDGHRAKAFRVRLGHARHDHLDGCPELFIARSGVSNLTDLARAASTARAINCSISCELKCAVPLLSLSSPRTRNLNGRSLVARKGNLVESASHRGLVTRCRVARWFAERRVVSNP